MSTEEIERLEDKIDKILYILNGNGKLGLSAKVNVMWGLGIFMVTTIAIQALSVLHLS